MRANDVDGPTGVPQVVSYSSRFVEKISDVVRTMNISAASAIKSGSIEVPGNSLSVDEANFLLSDLNVVVSVKVLFSLILFLIYPPAPLLILVRKHR